MTSPARALLLTLLAALVPASALAADAPQSFEALAGASEPTGDLTLQLRPFVATCDREKDRFRRLFCTALNERLKAQRQTRLYRYTVAASDVGPLVARYVAKPAPRMVITVRGCLTCREPLLARTGGDISKGRFFLFKLPRDIRIRRGKSLYDFGDIHVARYEVALPAKMKQETFERDILPFLRLDLVYRPVAGVTRVGRRFKYGVITFELAGHRVFDRCSGKVYGSVPATKQAIPPDKKDPTCPANRPKKVVPKVKLPARLDQRKVRTLMESVAADLHACYNQFGVAGDVPAVITVAPTGKVKAVKIGGKLARTRAAACVTRFIRALTFPKFAGESPVRVDWPFVIPD